MSTPNGDSFMLEGNLQAIIKLRTYLYIHMECVRVFRQQIIF